MMRLWKWIPLVVLTCSVCSVLAALLLHVSLDDVWQALGSSETRFALRLSMLTSSAALLLSLALGVPSGYVLARSSFPGQALIDTLLDLPLVMTPLVAGVGLLILFGQDWLGGSLGAIGLRLIFTPAGAVAAQTFIAVPIVVRSSRAAFEGVNRRYELAARTLGLGEPSIFFRITLPLARQGILTGAVLAWARALGEFGATLMIAGATRFKTATLPVSVYLNIGSGDLGAALACAWILLALGFVLLLAVKFLGRPGTTGAAVHGGVPLQ
jgi:molybdate transport system permease protein